MRIDKKKAAELEKRKGLTGRTIMAFLWLMVSFFAAFLISSWLFTSETIGTDIFYGELGIPETVSEMVLRVGLAIVIWAILQFVVLIVFAATSPKAKMRTGTPTSYSSKPDPYDDSINYH